MQHYLGIDPGMTGGLAVIAEDYSIIRLARFDKLEPLDVIRDTLGEFGMHEIKAIVEEIGPRPGQDVSSLFKLSTGYGQILGFLYAHLVDITLVHPRTWQKGLPISDTPKGRVRLFIEQKYGLGKFIFPGCRAAHQGCMDAVAIAVHQARVERGEIVAPKKPASGKKPRKVMRF